MRAKLVLVVLCLLPVLPLCVLLSDLQPPSNYRILLNTVSSSVARGNFSYWRLTYEGALLIELKSKKGDADLYVSDTERPSYEVDRNNFSSATCGLDTVHIPDDFKRPIGVGVFGDWSHEVSEYDLSVYGARGDGQSEWSNRGVIQQTSCELMACERAAGARDAGARADGSLLSRLLRFIAAFHVHANTVLL